MRGKGSGGRGMGLECVTGEQDGASPRHWHVVALTDTLTYITQPRKHSGLTVMRSDTHLTPVSTHTQNTLLSWHRCSHSHTHAWARIHTHCCIHTLRHTLTLADLLANINMWTHTVTHTEAQAHTHHWETVTTHMLACSYLASLIRWHMLRIRHWNLFSHTYTHTRINTHTLTRSDWHMYAHNTYRHIALWHDKTHINIHFDSHIQPHTLVHIIHTCTMTHIFACSYQNTCLHYTLTFPQTLTNTST